MVCMIAFVVALSAVKSSALIIIVVVSCCVVMVACDRLWLRMSSESSVVSWLLCGRVITVEKLIVQ